MKQTHSYHTYFTEKNILQKIETDFFRELKWIKGSEVTIRSARQKSSQVSMITQFSIMKYHFKKMAEKGWEMKNFGRWRGSIWKENETPHLSLIRLHRNQNCNESRNWKLWKLKVDQLWLGSLKISELNFITFQHDNAV